MSIPNCHCNVCGCQIYRAEPNARNKYCSRECERIDQIVLKPRKHGEEFTLDHVAKSKSRTAFAASHWPVVRPGRPSSNQGNTRLRVRGIKRLRLTTKLTQ